MRCSAPLATLLTLSLVGTACGSDDTDSDDHRDDHEAAEQVDAVELDAPTATPDETDGPTAASVGPSTPAVIRPGMSWHWQLQDDLDTSVDADVYDIDLFDTSAATIDELRTDGRIVICYFSTAWEDWRADADHFPAHAVGAPLDDWEGERWVDITDDGVRAVLAARLDLAVTKGCDGVEPDNVTAYRNDSGFDLDVDDQLDFNRFLAEEAHARNLLIGLKNGLEQIPDLVDDFDFAINEQCVQYEECDVYAPFVEAGKAIFGAEYSEEAVREPEVACAVASAAGISALVLPVELDGSFRTPCP